LDGSITFFGAFFAGLLSFLSPCVLPLVPPYLCYITGVSLDELQAEESTETRKKALLPALCFVLGFSVVFVSLGASASFIGGLITDHLEVLSKIAGVVIIIMGLHFIGLFRFAFLDREARYQYNARKINLYGAFFVGLAFAFGWTPFLVITGILFLTGGFSIFAYWILEHFPSLANIG